MTEQAVPPAACEGESRPARDHDRSKGETTADTGPAMRTWARYRVASVERRGRHLARDLVGVDRVGSPVREDRLIVAPSHEAADPTAVLGEYGTHMRAHHDDRGGAGEPRHERERDTEESELGS